MKIETPSAKSARQDTAQERQLAVKKSWSISEARNRSQVANEAQLLLALIANLESRSKVLQIGFRNTRAIAV